MISLSLGPQVEHKTEKSMISDKISTRKCISSLNSRQNAVKCIMHNMNLLFYVKYSYNSDIICIITALQSHDNNN